ncbi:MAG: hypothetical protein AAFZ15_11395 [Bacteroidota bacterium]
MKYKVVVSGLFIQILLLACQKETTSFSAHADFLAVSYVLGTDPMTQQNCNDIEKVRPAEFPAPIDIDPINHHSGEINYWLNCDILNDWF